ncbi:MAG: carboxypeptidase regulatory-like domain-containing protein [Candidatus Kerfeldbacteria bacterium]|nr:carboxypeptidase regulatory-like domain-containing protein [Candidatus Kerfeldbacteria bacterium]
MKHRSAFTLIEALMAVITFGIFMFGLILAFMLIIGTTSFQNRRTIALAIAQERIEAVRNIPYADVGVVGGIPSGILPNLEYIERESQIFSVLYDIRFVDDPFDGTFGNGDALPTDYKSIHVEVRFDAFGVDDGERVVTSSIVAPEGLESDAGGGNLLVEVLDSVNEPIKDAHVRVVNTDVDPDINFVVFTNADGEVFIPGAPEGTETYQITVSNNDYSTAQTYQASLQNPNPNPPHLSVFEGQLTSKKFFIDRLSTVALSTFDSSQLTKTWWDQQFRYRTQLTITNTGSVELTPGTVLSVPINHAGLVAATRSLSSGDDVRIVRTTGGTVAEQDRVAAYDTWNSATTTLWFRLTESIPVEQSNTNYYIYYGNSAATNPPIGLSNIFAPDAIGATAVWYAEDGTGTQLIDSGPNAHHGNLANTDGSAWVAGRHAGGLQWDGVDDCVTVPDHPDFSFSSSFTLEAWVKVAADTPSSTLLEKPNGLTHLYQMSVVENAGAKQFAFTYEDAGIDVTLQHSQALPVDQWVHVAAIVDRDAAMVQLSVDNIKDPGTPFVAFGNPNTNPVTIGCDSANRFFRGALDNIAMTPAVKTEFPSSLEGFGTGVHAPETFSVGTPISNATVTLTGSKSVGTDAVGSPIPKTILNVTTDLEGALTLEDVEYDDYSVTTDGEAIGYDIAGSIPQLPLQLSAGTTIPLWIFLAPHADHTLLISVENAQGQPVTGATIRVQNILSGFDQTVVTGFTGQSFFTSLESLTYDITVSAAGYQPMTFPLPVFGQTTQRIQLGVL